MRYVILGASAAGISAAKTLRELDKKNEIVLISEDLYVYSRCMLHHFISGEKSVEKLDFSEKDFFEINNIYWISGKRVKRLYADKKHLFLDDGNIITFDKLLIATGASSFLPPIKNLKEASNVFGLRNLEDAIKIKEAAEKSKNILVIGAGLVGIDAALGLINKSVNISIVEISDRLLPLQLDKHASLKYEQLFKEKGVQIYTSTSLAEVLIDDNNHIIGAKLSNGEEIICDMAIVAAGVRPNIDFIDEKEIAIHKGIVINEKCETSMKDIYAAGDVTGLTPIWPIAVKQGNAAAYNMTGIEKILNDNFAFKNSMNFLGLDTVSLGLTDISDSSYSIYTIMNKHVYKKIISKDNIIVGAILQGDISYAGVLTYLIKNRIDISRIHKSIFEIDYSDFFSVKTNGEFEYSIM